MAGSWVEFEEKARFLWNKAPMSTNFSFKYNHKKAKLQVKMFNRDDRKPLLLTQTIDSQTDLLHLIQLNRFLLQDSFGPMRSVETSVSSSQVPEKPKKKKKKKGKK